MALSTYYHYTVAYTQLRFIYTDKNALLVGWFVCFGYIFTNSWRSITVVSGAF